jgi:hypothetical protein
VPQISKKGLGNDLADASKQRYDEPGTAIERNIVLQDQKKSSEFYSLRHIEGLCQVACSTASFSEGLSAHYLGLKSNAFDLTISALER